MPRYLEEFRTGEVLLSAGRTITEADVAWFAALTGVAAGLVMADAQAGETGAGGLAALAAPGALIFSISTGLAAGHDRSQQPDLIAFFGVERMRFLEPVVLGDTVRLKQTVESAEPINENTGLLTMSGEIVNQEEVIALRYTAKLLVRRRPRPASSPAK
jgi:3-hydroxybutyryl-CoA dehydratase